jgi:hypothetical protein
MALRFQRRIKFLPSGFLFGVLLVVFAFVVILIIVANWK